MSDIDIAKVRRLLREGVTAKIVAAQLGVTPSRLNRALRVAAGTTGVPPRRRCDRCSKRTSRPAICFACEKGESK